MKPDQLGRRIIVLGLVMLACFVLLFVQLNNLQIREAPSLRANPDNPSQNPVATWYQNREANSWLVMAPFSPSPSIPHRVMNVVIQTARCTRM